MIDLSEYKNAEAWEAKMIKLIPDYEKVNLFAIDQYKTFSGERRGQRGLWSILQAVTPSGSEGGVWRIVQVQGSFSNGHFQPTPNGKTEMKCNPNIQPCVLHNVQKRRPQPQDE